MLLIVLTCFEDALQPLHTWTNTIVSFAMTVDETSPLVLEWSLDICSAWRNTWLQGGCDLVLSNCWWSRQVQAPYV